MPEFGSIAGESCFRALAEHLYDMVVVFDRSGVVRYVNPAVKRFVGFEPDELIGQRIVNLIHPDDVGRAKSDFSSMMAEGGLVHSTLRYRHKDGSWHAMETRTGNYLDVPEVRGFIVNARDTTELEQLKQAARQSDARVSQLLGSLPVSIYRCEPGANHAPSFVSENVLSLSGYPAKAFVDESGFWQEHVHPDDAPRIPGELAQLFERGTHAFRYRWRVADGRYRWFLDSMRLERSAEGTPQCIVGALQDITERVRVAEGFRAHAAEFEDLYNQAPCGYHSLDANGVFVRINNTELSWLGYSRWELVGRVKFADLLTPQSRRAFQEYCADDALRDRAHVLEYDMVRRDGTILPVLLSATWVRNAAGQYEMTRAALFDRTARVTGRS